LGILKTLTEKKNTRVDGQEPKRRGPKPDSKPALTRRQELNRQAQRTHRERKELYIKGLEVEVNRLKDNFANVARDKMSLAEENRQLKQLLGTHGINWNGNGGAEDFNVSDFTNINNHVNGNSNRGPSSTGYTSGSSISGTYASGSAAYSPPPHSNGARSLNQSPTSPHHFNSNGVMNMNGNLNGSRQHQGLSSLHNEDYEQQAGIDFVLTSESRLELERFFPQGNFKSRTRPSLL